MSDLTSTTGAVDSVFLFIIGISLFFLVLITFLMIFFIIKYNKKRHKKAMSIHGNTTLEIIWTIVPTIIVLFMFYLGWKGFQFIRTVPENSMTVSVTARMWSWLFEYENGVQTDTLYVPANRPVKLLLQSQDVIHSFFIPAFRIKEDAVPGLENYLWFEANEAGNYDVLCAEYCGLRHSYMYTKVVALPQAEFDTWYSEMEKEIEKSVTQSGAESDKGNGKPLIAGKKLIRTKGCIACHSSDGSKMIGPTFQGIFGKQQIVVIDGEESEVVIDDEYLRRSILQPNLEVVKGYNALMPAQGEQISEQELVAIIQYLKEL
jgi:cytochrome c oxidase subunit 2